MIAVGVPVNLDNLVTAAITNNVPRTIAISLSDKIVMGISVFVPITNYCASPDGVATTIANLLKGRSKR